MDKQPETWEELFQEVFGDEFRQFDLPLDEEDEDETI